MHFNILTVFPEMFPGTLDKGVVGRALEKGIWSYNAINIRDFAINNYGSVDDEQFGGGAGMVMRPDVLGNAIDSIENKGKIIFFSPRGKPLKQQMVHEYIKNDTMTLLCGRYEGVDQRVIDEYDIEEYELRDIMESVYHNCPYWNDGNDESNPFLIGEEYEPESFEGIAGPITTISGEMMC